MMEYVALLGAVNLCLIAPLYFIFAQVHRTLSTIQSTLSRNALAIGRLEGAAGLNPETE